MRNVQQWLDAYSESHRHPRNKLLHWIGIPLIAFSLFGLLSLVSASGEYMNLATLLVVGSLLYICSSRRDWPWAWPSSSG